MIGQVEEVALAATEGHLKKKHQSMWAWGLAHGSNHTWSVSFNSEGQAIDTGMGSPEWQFVDGRV